jgi:SAM-dependent methyltransferase
MSAPGDHRDLYFQWEVRTWSRALPLWVKSVRSLPGTGGEALALGERDGGLSLLLAEQGFRTVCSDLEGPTDKAAQLHADHGFADAISYEAIDATSIPKPDGSFDVVAFKSMLGAMGTKERQAQALREMCRVLKPGGVLLFAENLSASPLHRWLRTRFVNWGQRWRYIHPTADQDLFAGFGAVEMQTTGFLAPLGRSEAQRNMLARVDALLLPLVPKVWRTVCYGVARK